MGALSGLTGISGLSGVAGSSAWTPAALSLDLWLEARSGTFSDAGTTPAVDTDPVYQWNDLSGNANHAVQITLGNRPTLQTASGFKVVRADGTDDLMTLTSTINFSTGPFTVVAILKTDSNDGHVLIDNSPGGQFRVNQEPDKLSSFDGSNNPKSDVFNSSLNFWAIPSWRRSATSVEFFEGTTARGTATLNGTMTEAYLFDRPGGGLFLGADVAAIFAVNRALSNEELANLVAYGQGLHP